jgi:hypothetical protein
MRERLKKMLKSHKAVLFAKLTRLGNNNIMNAEALWQTFPLAIKAEYCLQQ